MSFTHKVQILFCAILFSSLSGLQAQSYQGLEAVKLVNALDGDSISLDFKKSGQLVAIIFTSNYCPYSRKYEDRINKLHQTYAKRKVTFILVNPNDGPDESLDEMKEKAITAGYQFPYLKDEDQILAGILDANRTPEAFLLKPAANGFELVYHGALDDNPQTASDVGNPYLKNAIEAALSSNPIPRPEVRVTGCIIKR